MLHGEHWHENIRTSTTPRGLLHLSSASCLMLAAYCDLPSKLPQPPLLCWSQRTSRLRSSMTSEGEATLRPAPVPIAVAAPTALASASTYDTKVWVQPYITHNEGARHGQLANSPATGHVH